MAKWDKKIKRENGVKWSGVVNLLNCARTPIFYTTNAKFVFSVAVYVELKKLVVMGLHAL